MLSSIGFRRICFGHSGRPGTHSNAPTTPRANKYVEVFFVGSFDVLIKFQRQSGPTLFNKNQTKNICKLINELIFCRRKDHVSPVSIWNFRDWSKWRFLKLFPSAIGLKSEKCKQYTKIARSGLGCALIDRYSLFNYGISRKAINIHFHTRPTVEQQQKANNEPINRVQRIQRIQIQDMLTICTYWGNVMRLSRRNYKLNFCIYCIEHNNPFINKCTHEHVANTGVD